MRSIERSDTKLDRNVAIKVLPEEFASRRRAPRPIRKREAKLLASLNHPNIASIHGFEESDGVNALVLELVEGPTLAEAHPSKAPSPSMQAHRYREADCGGARSGVTKRASFIAT